MSALRTGRLYLPRNTPGTHFCQRLSRPQGNNAAGRIMSTKNSNDTIGNRTRNLPTCTAVLKPIAPLRARIWVYLNKILYSTLPCKRNKSEKLPVPSHLNPVLGSLTDPAFLTATHIYTSFWLTNLLVLCASTSRISTWRYKFFKSLLSCSPFLVTDCMNISSLVR
jgi:hypothetical protein